MNGSGMVLPQSGKAVANESNYPYNVELAVGADELDFGLSRQITEVSSVATHQAATWTKNC
jgi:hypothetical protein